MSSKTELWSTLPESLWLSIFCRCDSMDLLSIRDVCLQWQRIAKDFELTSRLDLRSKTIKTNNLIDLLVFTENNLISVKIRNNRIKSSDEVLDTITEEVMHILRDECKQLKRLSLEDMTDVCIQYQSLPNSLTHLSITNCRTDCLNIFESNSSQSSEKFETIVYLNISQMSAFDSVMCRTINRFVSLKYLYLESLFRVNCGGITSLSTQLISHLVVIDLEGTDVRNESFEYILNYGKALKELYFGRTLINRGFDLTKSVAKQLKVLCLLNTCVEILSVKNILRLHTKLESVICDENIVRTIDSPLLMSKPNASDCETCFHYLSDNRFDKS